MMEQKLESVSITAYKGQTVLWRVYRANNFYICQGQNWWIREGSKKKLTLKTFTAFGTL